MGLDFPIAAMCFFTKDINIQIKELLYSDTLRNIALQFDTMEDKFEKKTVCEYCGSQMDAKYRSKRFCSGKCRTYWNRENNVKKEAPQSIADLSKNGDSLETYTTNKHSETEYAAVEILSSSINEIPPMPGKRPGEHGIDYAARKSEWKLKYNQK